MRKSIVLPFFKCLVQQQLPSLINTSIANKNSVLKVQLIKSLHTSHPNRNSDEDGNKKIPRSLLLKYKEFRENESKIIYDRDEEQLMADEIAKEMKEESTVLDVFHGLNLKRGATGVFDVDEMFDILKEEKVVDICTLKVSKHINYVDYIMIGTVKSSRHLTATSEFIRRYFKMKRNAKEGIPPIEGDKDSDWVAMDLGNIALHLMKESSRKMYDIEMLWAVGPEFDELVQKAEELQPIEKYTILLSDLTNKEHANSSDIDKLKAVKEMTT